MPSHAGSTTSSASNGPTGEEVRTRPGVAVNRPLYSPPPVSTAASSANSRPLAQPLASPSSAFRGNEGQPIQRGYGDNAYRPVGTAPRVDPSRPLTYQTMSYLNPSNPQSSGTVDGKANAPSPAQRASNQPAASGGATNGASTPAPGKSSYRKEPQTVPELPLAEGLKKPNGEYNCGPINAYAGQYEKQAGARALAVINAPYRSEARCTARCDALAWREEVLSKYQYTGSWSCSSAAVRMWNAVGPNYTGYNNGNNGDGCTCVGSNGAPLAFSPEPK